MINKMKKTILGKLLILPVIFMLNGCVYLIVGGIGAVGGYVVSPDTVEGLTENDYTSVWEAAVEIISVMGIIELQQEEAGILNARMNGAAVTISVIKINEGTSKLRIKARKNMLPKISTAQDVFVKVMNYLNE